MNVDPSALETTLEDGKTIRQYFQELLLELWRDPHGFNGKRPLDKGGWNIDIACALIRGGFIEGIEDEEGDILDYNAERVEEYVAQLIRDHLFCQRGDRPPTAPDPQFEPTTPIRA
jgi:hypothetical protein